MAITSSRSLMEGNVDEHDNTFLEHNPDVVKLIAMKVTRTHVITPLAAAITAQPFVAPTRAITALRDLKDNAP